MATLSSNGVLKPPASIGRITAFLGEIASRQTFQPDLLESETVGSAVSRHAISGVDVNGFLGWLHVDRHDQPVKEKEIEPPTQDFAKPPLPDVSSRRLEDDEESDEQGYSSDDDKPGLELSQQIRSFEKITRKIHSRSPVSIPPVSKAHQFLMVNNGGFTAQTLALTQPDAQIQNIYQQGPGQTIRETLIEQQFTGFPAAPGSDPKVMKPLTYGLAAQAATQTLIDQRNATPAVWNEPVRNDILPSLGKPNMQMLANAPGSAEAVEPELMSDPLFGQITLIAPPLEVTAPGGGSALKFDWRDMAKGSGPLDYESLATLATTLPKGAKAMYPAMDPRQLTQGAVNLRLTPKLVGGLAEMGFAAGNRVDAKRSVKMADNYYGGTPAVQMLAAQISPVNRPGRNRGSQSPDLLPQLDTGAPAEGPERRMRFIDYLGLPIYLSQNFSATPDLEQEMHSRVTTEFMPRAPMISGISFFNLKNRMLGGFNGIVARPEQGAWRKAAPNYERSSIALSLMLNQGMRSGSLGDGLTHSRAQLTKPFAPKIPNVAAPMRSGLGASPQMQSAGTSAFSPALGIPQVGTAPRSASVGSAPQGSGNIPRFISPATPSARSAMLGVPAATAGQAETGGHAQSATAPKSVQPIGFKPQIGVAPEKPAGKPIGTVASKPTPVSSPPPAQSAPKEGPKPAKGSIAPIPLTPKPAPTPSPVQPPQPKPSEQKMPDLGPTHGNASSLKPPQMLVAPHRPVQGPTAQHPEMSVQTGNEPSSGGSGAESGNGRAAKANEKMDSGLPGSEINLLANEVWSVLKRRIAFEAQRSGR